MIRITDIKIHIDEEDSKIKDEILKILKIKGEQLINYKIARQSVDARKKDNICFVYTIDVEVKNQESILKNIKKNNIIISPDEQYKFVKMGNEKIINRPVIVGTGPCGLFAGLVLSQMGYKPILLERGKCVEERSQDVELFWQKGILNEESNVQFGEGGAGTFSDGKLTTLIKDKDNRCKKILQEFVNFGANQNILYKNKPHIGTDILKQVVKNMSNEIINLGGEIRFNSKMTNLIVEDNQVKGVEVNNKEVISSNIVILAIGHSSRDTFYMLNETKIPMQQKPFSIGIRIEHPQKLINENQYGTYAEHPKLGSADYKLSHHCGNGRTAYTFCMCPGGQVVGASSEKEMVVTNGMSESKRDKENANSALLVEIKTSDFESEHPLAGVEFQRKWERKAFEVGGKNYNAPVQLVGDFLNGKSSKAKGEVNQSYTPDVLFTDLSLCLPDYVIDSMKEAIVAFDRKIKGFAMNDSVMTGVEARSSSPVRINRNDYFESEVLGLYPAGEGAGYAGGIISAAVDGIRVAEAIAMKYGRD